MRYKIVHICMLLVIVISVSGCGNEKQVDKTVTVPVAENKFNISILKVGQADAIILQTENRTVVIDCGEEDDGDEVVEYLKNAGAEKIDYLFITHYDKDHVGGASEVLNNFKTDEIVMPDYAGAFGVFDPDGKLTINEGVSIVVASGNGSLTTAENQINIYCETTHNADEIITLKDSSGKVILEYAPKGGFRAVLISSPTLEIGKSYTVIIGDEVIEVTLSEQKTVIGTQTGGNMGGFGGRPR